MTRAAKIQQNEVLADQFIESAIISTGMNAPAAEWLRSRKELIFFDDGREISSITEISNNCMRLAKMAECGIADIDTPADFLVWFSEHVNTFAKDIQAIYGFDIPAQRLENLLNRIYLLVDMVKPLTAAEVSKIVRETNSKPKHVKELHARLHSRDYEWIVGRVSSFARCETVTAAERSTSAEEHYFLSDDGEHVVVEKEVEAEYISLFTLESALDIIEKFKLHHPVAYQQLQEEISAVGICADADDICQIVARVWARVQEEIAEVEAMAEAVVAAQELVEVAVVEEETSVVSAGKEVVSSDIQLKEAASFAVEATAPAAVLPIEVTDAATPLPPRQRLSPSTAPSPSPRSSLRSSTRSSNRKSPLSSAGRCVCYG